MRDFLFYAMGSISGILLYVLLFNSKYVSKKIESKQKPIIDYKLEGNGKQIDTIWIYTFKKQ